MLIGYSGGLDSTVLLVLAKQFADRTGAALRAIYIDHQLHPDSNHWAEHCARTCHALNVEFEAIRVQLGDASRANLEEAARDARYRVFADKLRSGECLLTAHHADDQAETLLLQLLRGAGVKGMAAMPARRPFDGGQHLRPLLQISRDALHRYALAKGLQWIDDPSNDDHRFDRNLVRQQLLPLLLQRWPNAINNICRSAAHCATAADLMVDTANADLADFADYRQLPVPRLRELDSKHRRNLLRCWIEVRGFRMPSTAQLAQIEASLVTASDDRIGDVQWANGQMRRYADGLYLAARGELSDAPSFEHSWQNCEQDLYIPELQVTLSPNCLPANLPPGIVQVHSRRGGERFYPPGNRQRKQLKKWFQEQRIPPWQRNRVIVFSQASQVVGIHGPV